MREAAIASCLYDVASRLSGASGADPEDVFPKGEVPPLDEGAAAVTACVMKNFSAVMSGAGAGAEEEEGAPPPSSHVIDDDGRAHLETALERVMGCARPLVQLLTGEEAGVREQVVARAVETLARLHPDVQSALLNAGAVKAVASRLHAHGGDGSDNDDVHGSGGGGGGGDVGDSGDEARGGGGRIGGDSGVGSEALRATLLKALNALVSTRAETPSHVRAKLAAHLVDTGAVRQASACLKSRLACAATEPAAVDLRVAAADALLTMAAGGAEGAAAGSCVYIYFTFSSHQRFKPPKPRDSETVVSLTTTYS